MAFTPDSASTSYMTVAEFQIAKDIRPLGMLAVDNGTQLTQQQQETSDRIQFMLDKASGELESACFAGERYNADDLQALNGVSSVYMKGLIADLAYYYLYKTRGASLPAHVEEDFKRAWDVLEKLRSGDRIFSFVETGEAGLVDSAFIQPADYLRLGYVTSLTRWAGRRTGHDRNILP